MYARFHLLRSYFLFAIFLQLSKPSFSQLQIVEEDIIRLNSEIENAKHDSVIVLSLLEMTNLFEFKPDTLPVLIKRNKEICERNLEKETLSDIELKFFQKAELEVDFQRAWYFRETGKVADALETFKSISMKAGENKLYILEGNAHMFMGFLRASIGQEELAFEDHLKSLELFKLAKDTLNIGRAHNNVAMSFLRKKQDSIALYHGRMAYQMIMKSDPGSFILNYNLNFMMDYFLKKNELDSASKYSEITRELLKNTYDLHGIILNYVKIAQIEVLKGNMEKARSFADSSHKYALQSGNPYFIASSSGIKAKVYENFGEYRMANELLRQQIAMNDSLNSKKSQQISLGFEIEKERLLAEQERKRIEAEARVARQKQNLVIVSVSVILVLVVVFSRILYKRLQITRNQKKTIEVQNYELAQTNEEVRTQRDNIEVQKEQIELKNRQITESIEYARRIQKAVLPSNSSVRKLLPESFVIHIPKDIVAGDFYWLEKLNDILLFAVADCTGHGVPGAMVSVICNNGLNRSVREHKLSGPGEILDKTREIIVEEFEKSEEDVQDGMDIALCSLKGNRLEYAGAHNPVIIIRNGSDEVELIKPNKQPIGKFDHPEPYTSNIVEVEKGDMIYLFSDGLQDQFGGPKGKKFMISRFKKLLLQISMETLDRQKELILKALYDWKGEEEQVDDICIMGVRV